MNLSAKKAWLLGSVIICVDLATAANLFAFFSYFEAPVFAALVALSFILLQVGTLVLYAQPLAEGIRRWLLVGVGILLFVTGLSNVAIGYLHSRPIFPAEELLPALGIGGMNATALGVLAAMIAGLSLIIVALIFWTALGTYIRDENQRQHTLAAQLDEILRKRVETQ